MSLFWCGVRCPCFGMVIGVLALASLQMSLFYCGCKYSCFAVVANVLDFYVVACVLTLVWLQMPLHWCHNMCLWFWCGCGCPCFDVVACVLALASFQISSVCSGCWCAVAAVVTFEILCRSTHWPMNYWL